MCSAPLKLNLLGCSLYQSAGMTLIDTPRNYIAPPLQLSDTSERDQCSISKSSEQRSTSSSCFVVKSFMVAFPAPPQPFVAPSPAPAPLLITIPGATVYPQPIGHVPAVYSYPQYQAHQFLQRDSQTITPKALQNVKAALASSETEHKAETKKRVIPCKAVGKSWEDPTLAEWP